MVTWAETSTDIQAVALVGSYAREAAKEDSDIDLVMLCDDPRIYLANPEWVEQFGQVDRQQVEDYGRLISLRIWYLEGPEVEFGLTTTEWAATPLDEGTRRVISDGMVVLYDRSAWLSSL